MLFRSGDQRVERDLVLGGRDYRLLVNAMAPNLGRRFQIAAAVPSLSSASIPKYRLSSR